MAHITFDNNRKCVHTTSYSNRRAAMDLSSLRFIARQKLTHGCASLHMRDAVTNHTLELEYEYRLRRWEAKDKRSDSQPFENKDVLEQTRSNCWSEEMAKVYSSRSARRLTGSLLENHFQCAKCTSLVQRIVTGGGPDGKMPCSIKALLEVVARRCNGSLRLVRHLAISQRQAPVLHPDAAVHIACGSCHFEHPIRRCTLHWRFNEHSSCAADLDDLQRQRRTLETFPQRGQPSS